MQTELARKLGIEFPIFAFTHCRDVVVAVSKAGGFGVLGAVGFTPEQLETSYPRAGQGRELQPGGPGRQPHEQGAPHP